MTPIGYPPTYGTTPGDVGILPHFISDPWCRPNSSLYLCFLNWRNFIQSLIRLSCGTWGSVFQWSEALSFRSMICDVGLGLDSNIVVYLVVFKLIWIICAFIRIKMLEYETPSFRSVKHFLFSLCDVGLGLLYFPVFKLIWIIYAFIRV